MNQNIQIERPLTTHESRTGLILLSSSLVVGFLAAATAPHYESPINFDPNEALRPYIAGTTSSTESHLQVAAPPSDEQFAQLAIGLASRQSSLRPEITAVLSKRQHELYE